MAEKTYIATEPLFVGTARAHNPGDEVPAENVERHGWKDSVAAKGTKAANAAQGLTEESQSQAQPPATA